MAVIIDNLQFGLNGFQISVRPSPQFEPKECDVRISHVASQIVCVRMVLTRSLKSNCRPLELFAKFNTPSVHAAVLVDVMKRGFDFSSSWVQLFPHERIQFQDRLKKGNKHCQLLSRYVHHLNIERCASLTDQEKILFFNACRRYFIPKQYERLVFFEFICHVANINASHAVNAKKIISTAYKWKKWSRNEMKQFISFCNGFNFFIVDLKTTLRELTKSSKDPFQVSVKEAFVKKYAIEQFISKGIRTLEELVAVKGISYSDLFVMGAQNINNYLPAQQMLKFLSTAPASFVADNTAIAVQLIASEAMRGQQSMLKESLLVLQSLNMSRVSMPFFRRLAFRDPNFKNFQPFVECIRKDHDNRLATASFEQVEEFYRALEVDLKVNDDFLKQHKEAVVKVENVNRPVPDLPEGVEIAFDELLEMFQKLNFTDKKGSNYINLELLELHQRAAAAEDMLKPHKITFADLKIGIENLVSIAKKPHGYYGFPQKDKKAQKMVFRDYTLYLKHIILKLKTCSEVDRNTSLVWLAAAGLHCGSAHLSVAEYLYFHLFATSYNPNLYSLKEVLVQYVIEARRGVVNDQLNRITTETHSRVTVMREVGKKFDLPEATTYQFEDEWAKDADPHFQDPSVLNRFLAKCRQELSATQLINVFIQRMDGFPGSLPSISTDFRASKLNSWFKEQYSKDKSVLEKVYNDDVTRIRRRYVIQLLLSHDILQLNYNSWNVFKAWKTHYWELNAGNSVSD